MNYLSKIQKRQFFIWTSFFLVASFAIIQLAKINFLFMTLVAPTFFVFISTYHFYRQDLGVCSMYRSLQKTVHPYEIYFERFLVFFMALFIPTFYWLTTGTRYYSLLNFVGGPLPLKSFLEYFKVFGIFLYVAYIFYQIFYKRNFNMRFVYMAIIFTSFLSIMKPELFLFPFLIQYIARIFTHDWLEIGFQSRLLRAEYKSKKANSIKKVLMCLILTGIITYFFAFSKQTYQFMTTIQQNGYLDGEKLKIYLGDPVFELWAAVYFFASAYHYFVGRYVYNFSIPEVRKKLSFEA